MSDYDKLADLELTALEREPLDLDRELREQLPQLAGYRSPSQ